MLATPGDPVAPHALVVLELDFCVLERAGTRAKLSEACEMDENEASRAGRGRPPPRLVYFVHSRHEISDSVGSRSPRQSGPGSSFSAPRRARDPGALQARRGSPWPRDIGDRRRSLLHLTLHRLLVWKASGVVPVLFVTGPIGVGKTTVLLEADALLIDADARHATVELEDIARCWTDATQSSRRRFVYKNLAALWSNFASVGASRLLLGGLVEHRSELRLVSEAVPHATVTVVRCTRRCRCWSSGSAGVRQVLRKASSTARAGGRSTSTRCRSSITWSRPMAGP
jgi:hypothetical protein